MAKSVVGIRIILWTNLSLLNLTVLVQIFSLVSSSPIADHLSFSVEEPKGNHYRAKRGTPAADWEQRRWPNNTVFYVIDERLSSIKAEIERAMAVIESISCVRYVPRTDEVDYVFLEQNSTMCLEPVGRQGGEQKILINIPDCAVYGFYLHASMQMLGFYHEHQRLDRDEHVSVHLENVTPEWLWAFEKLNETSHFWNSSYDINSIMQYGSYQFSLNGEPTVLSKDGEEILSWVEKTELSPLDILAINDYYNCPQQ